MRMKPVEKGMTKARSEHGIINFVSQKSSAFVSSVELFLPLAALSPGLTFFSDCPRLQPLPRIFSRNYCCHHGLILTAAKLFLSLVGPLEPHMLIGDRLHRG
jgi:hypothetical protein